MGSEKNMVVINLLDSMYLATPPPWSHQKGVNVRRRPHHTSPRVKQVNKNFAAAARSLRGTRGRAPGRAPNISYALGDRLRGNGSGRVTTEEYQM